MRASRPYVLKNLAGVYSCSCPAWRNQSIGIERRTCKHLRMLRGDAAEEVRLGSALPAKPSVMEGKAQALQFASSEFSPLRGKDDQQAGEYVGNKERLRCRLH
jgi:DNA ligase-1